MTLYQAQVAWSPKKLASRFVLSLVCALMAWMAKGKERKPGFFLPLLSEKKKYKRMRHQSNKESKGLSLLSDMDVTCGC